jgi:hypothetical protein
MEPFSLAPVSPQISLLQAYSNAAIFAHTISASGLPVGSSLQSVISKESLSGTRGNLLRNG